MSHGLISRFAFSGRFWELLLSCALRRRLIGVSCKFAGGQTDCYDNLLVRHIYLGSPIHFCCLFRLCFCGCSFDIWVPVCPCVINVPVNLSVNAPFDGVFQQSGIFDISYSS
jgi:hypothetical protein